MSSCQISPLHGVCLAALLAISSPSFGLTASNTTPTSPSYELIVALDPSLTRVMTLSSRLKIASELLDRYGLGEPLRLDKVGSIVFAMPETFSLDQNRKLAADVAKAPGVLHASLTLGLEQRRVRDHRRAFSVVASDKDILGVIIKFRDPEMGRRSRSNEPLSEVELQRLKDVANIDFSRSRPMSGDSFVAYFVEPLSSTAVEPILRRLEGDPKIEHVSPNALAQSQLVPNDPLFAQQWSLATTPAGIEAPRAWDITTGSSATVVAIIDTGILGHPEFAGRLLQGYDFISNSLHAGDGDGRDSNPADAGDWHPADFCGLGKPASTSTWHGTHVTGIIAATGGNGAGMAGIDWHTRILPVRALGKCGGDTADIADAMRWSAGLPVPGVPPNATPARVINMSLGGPTPCSNSPAYQQAALEILATGSALVVSAGNNTDEAANFSPAGCYGVITVGATGPNGDRAYYSNYSTLTLDLSAPGGNIRDFGAAGGILSTFASGTQADPGVPTFGDYQGTSQAAPHVSGTIALMLAANPALTIAQIRDIVIYSSKPFAAGSSCAIRADCGHGILNAGDAVDFARQFVGSNWNFSDHWYNPMESGWGVQVVAQGQTIFATWYTYGADGSPLWFTAILTRTSQDIFIGDIYYTNGVPLPQINGQQSSTSVQKVGQAVFAFFGYYEGWFYYNIPGVIEAAKPITRLVFASPESICYYTYSSRANSPIFQDIWWKPIESGWGINLTHQGSTIFATWFTYGSQGKPLWLSMVAQRQSPTVYSGRFNITSGVPFDRINGTQSFTSVADVGSGTITFTSGETAHFDYNVFGFAGSKEIQRQVFSTPVTDCAPSQ